MAHINIKGELIPRKSINEYNLIMGFGAINYMFIA